MDMLDGGNADGGLFTGAGWSGPVGLKGHPSTLAVADQPCDGETTAIVVSLKSPFCRRRDSHFFSFSRAASWPGMKTPSGPPLAPLLPIARDSALPLHRQIADGIRRAILNGVLRGGARLPASRSLALELGVSRLPVLAAYDQLRHESFLVGRAGSGTFVAHLANELPRQARSRRRHGGDARMTRDSAIPPSVGGLAARTVDDVSGSTARDLADGTVLPFRVSAPALDEFPREQWSRIVARHARTLSSQHMMYGASAGLARTRQAIAEHLRVARVVQCDADQVVIVSGSQAALRLCATVLVESNESVALEEPGYPGARAAFRASGLNLQAVRVDRSGLVVSELEALRRQPRAVYVTPAHQYPMGSMLSAGRRVELLAWASRNAAWVIEDDYDSDFRYVSRPLGALQGQDANQRVVYVGSLSKIMFPALRLGYLVVPAHLVDTFRAAKDAFDLFSPTLYQLAVAEFMEDGSFTRHLRRMRGVYLGRRNALVAALERDCADLLSIHNAEAGLHLTALLHPGIDDAGVVRQLMDRGLAGGALSNCFLGDVTLRGLLLGFGGSSEAELDRASRLLGEVLQRAVKS
jgi:GntR family transcriptional regulator / MocR family aminotransferase